MRALVDLHGGTITAHSEGRGCGSEFRLVLPLAATERPNERPARPAPDLTTDQRSPTRLLVVDDDADLADTTAELLAGRGFVTRVARDGEEAIRAFAQFRPHAALIDIRLPMLNGLDLARRLREMGTEARLIAVSGYGRREDEEASLAAGFDLHLVKPVRFDIIEAHLRGIDQPGRMLRARGAGGRAAARHARASATSDGADEVGEPVPLDQTPDRGAGQATSRPADS